jgi:hypothetical protein
MEDEKIIVLNKIIVNKLESISFDIKYYINANAIIHTLDKENVNAFKFMDDEDISELIEIRKRTKLLVYKLKNKLGAK